MPLNPDKILGYWCNKAAQAFRSQLDENVKQIGLRWSEAIVMLILYEHPSSLVELAKSLEHAHPSVLRQIDSLESAGYLSRSAHPEDRRVKIVSLTEKGNEAALKVFEIAKGIHDRATRGFGEEKVEQAIIMLRDIVVNLGEEDRLVMAHEPRGADARGSHKK